jgi:hypothetical protein
MTQRDIAGYLGVDVKTIRNWRKLKPNLYKTLMQGFAFEEVIKQSKENYEKLNNLSKSLISSTDC